MLSRLAARDPCCLLNPSTKASASPCGGGCGPAFMPGFVLARSSPGSSGHHLHLHLHRKSPSFPVCVCKRPLVPGGRCCPDESRAAEEAPHRWGCHGEREAAAGFPRGCGEAAQLCWQIGAHDSTGHFPPARLISPQHFSREAGALQCCPRVPSHGVLPAALGALQKILPGAGSQVPLGYFQH